MKPPDIYAAIDKLRRVADHPAASRLLTESDRTLLVLANLVDQTVTAIDGPAMREMTGRMLHLLADLRAAVPQSKGLP